MASPELQEELEALQWTYGDEVQVSMDDVDGQRVHAIHAKLFPNTGEREEQRFVEATLLLTEFSDSYPATAPRLELRDARGLGDEREQQLQVVLERERDSLLGSMMVGQVIEAGREFLTVNNHPEGRCAFCLEDMVSDTGINSQDEKGGGGLVKLPFCYHAFHKCCFVGWWAWRQHSLMQKEKELIAHAGISSPESIIADQLPAKEEHAGWKATVFCTLCPCCRAEAPLPSLGHLDKELRVALRALLYPSKSESAHKDNVDAKKEAQQSEGTYAPAGFNTKTIAETQARHRLIFEKQQAAGGIISSDAAASSYSISSSSTAGLQQEAAEDAAAEGTGPTSVGCSGSKPGENAGGMRSGRPGGIATVTATAGPGGSDSTGASAQQRNANGRAAAAAGGAAGPGCVRGSSPGWQGRGAGRGRHRDRQQGHRPNSQPVQGVIEAEAGQRAPTWQCQLAPDPRQREPGSSVSSQGLHVSDGFQHSAAGQRQGPPAHLQGGSQQGRGNHHAPVATNGSYHTPHQNPAPGRSQAASVCHLPGAGLPDGGRHQRGRGRRGVSQGRRGGRKQEQSS